MATEFQTRPLSSSNSSPPELNTPSPIEELLEPSILANNVPLPILMNKCSIHHQDAEASIADANDCLRMISGKINWFHRKLHFCPHLMSADDAKQIAMLHQKLLIEEIPFRELQNRLSTGQVVDIPRELEGRSRMVCQLFNELKQRIETLITNMPIINQTGAGTAP